MRVAPTLHDVRRRRIRLAVGLVLAVGLFGVPWAVPVAAPRAEAASNCKLDLEAGHAHPSSGSVSTSFTFSVRVTWKASCAPPASVTVTIVGFGSGATTSLSPGTPSTGQGNASATYRGQRTVAKVGSWAYEFAARMTAQDGWLTLVGTSPATIKVAAAPKPTPTPTPKPKPKPTPSPTPKPKPAPKPTPKPKPTPTREPAPVKATERPAPIAPTPPPPESAEPTAALPSPTATSPEAPVPTDDPAERTFRPVTAFVLPPPGSGPAPPRGPVVAPPSAPFQGAMLDPQVILVLAVWLASATVGSLLFVVALGRRSRAGDDGALALAMALAPRPSDVAAGTDRTDPDARDGRQAPPDPEAMIPRWRRPSLQAARQSAIIGVDVPRLPLRFATGESVADRRLVGYRLVLVSDRPEDLDAVEIGRLDRGDEVDLLRRENGFALIRAPDGLQGWVVESTLEAGPADDPAID